VSLLIAALSAEGTSTIDNIEQIDRGYQHIDTRLNALGRGSKMKGDRLNRTITSYPARISGMILERLHTFTNPTFAPWNSAPIMSKMRILIVAAVVCSPFMASPPADRSGCHPEATVSRWAPASATRHPNSPS
jgi:hypothetical protein